MSNYNLSLDGLEELLATVEEASNLDDVKKVVKMDTAYMADAIARGTPVKTGNLKRSETVAIKETGLTGEVTATADYSPYVEYGTRYMYGRYYMRKGQNIAGAKFLKDLERLVK